MPGLGRKPLYTTQNQTKKSNKHNLLKSPVPTKMTIHTGSTASNNLIASRAKIGKNLKGSQSTHKIDFEKSKELSSIKAFSKAPKIATKKDIYSKVTRRNKINLVRIFYFSKDLLHEHW